MSMRWIAQLVLAALFLLQPSNLLESITAQSVTAQSVTAQPNSILITGVVTSEESGAPLANVPIVLVDSAFPIDASEAARTDSSGRYTATQTFMSSWWIRFDSPDAVHIPEYYDNIYTADIHQARVFTFTPGMVVTGVDAALAVRGQSQITGKVMGEPEGTPLENVYVDI